MEPFSDNPSDYDCNSRPVTFEYLQLLQQHNQYKYAPQLIANGNISPAIDFAQRVLVGEDLGDALKKEHGTE